MKFRITNLPEIKMIGEKTIMSVLENKTRELWQGFMPKRAMIEKREGSEFYSVIIYDDLSYFAAFNPANTFEKWAAVQVSSTDVVPEDMSVLIIPSGLYVVFNYIGKASEAQSAYQYIFGEWLPKSKYQLDDRPHFAKMGDKYKNDSPDSEEELWVPIKE